MRLMQGLSVSFVPRPRFKGKYCVGERKRYKLCNLQACPRGQPSFREVQCSKFDSVLLDKKLYTWVPVANDGEHLHPGPAPFQPAHPHSCLPCLGPQRTPVSCTVGPSMSILWRNCWMPWLMALPATKAGPAGTYASMGSAR